MKGTEKAKQSTVTLNEILDLSDVEPKRIRCLNNRGLSAGSFIIYWMRNSQRSEMNPALNLAIETGNRLNLPVVVFFTCNSKYPVCNSRQYNFMLAGIADVKQRLLKKKILTVIWVTEPVPGIRKIARGASLVITDAGYMKRDKEVESIAAQALKCPLVGVESNIIVPLKALPEKEEYSAATLRPKIKKIISNYLNPAPDPLPDVSSLELHLKYPDLSDYGQFKNPDIINSGLCVVQPCGGNTSANRLLSKFLSKRINSYSTQRNDPDLDVTSHLSSYLHFGHISPVKVALAALKEYDSNTESFLDELIVRRELSFNFVNYNHNYDNISCIPLWASDSLFQNKDVEREYLYTLHEFEKSLTHDQYWNAAQNELATTGCIHNYMRMYWGKKIIEWTDSPEIAFDYMIYLNNKYALDGNDPNSYAGIAWCFGKYDRPWGSRPVFGKVRYMNDKGLKRKFKMKTYMNKYSVDAAG